MSDALTKACMDLVNESTARRACMDLLECGRQLRSCDPQGIYYAAEKMLRSMERQPDGNKCCQTGEVQLMDLPHSFSSRGLASRLLDGLTDDVPELSSVVVDMANRLYLTIVSIVGMYAGSEGLCWVNGKHNEDYCKLANYAWVMLVWGFPHDEITRLLRIANNSCVCGFNIVTSPLSELELDELGDDLSHYEAARDTRVDELGDRLVGAYNAENA